MPANISFDEAMNKTGFGLYSYLITSFAGICSISFSCVGFGSVFIIPTSACELGTTVSEKGALAAGPMVGFILSGVWWGYVADTYGRRAMLFYSLVGGALVNIIATISVNWMMLLVLHFITSVLTSGMYSIAMTLLSESVPDAKRNLVVLLVSTQFLLGQGIMALLAMPIIPLNFSHYLPVLGIYWNSWRLLMLVYSIPNLITAVFLYFMQESPKFVFIKGDEERALKILRTIYRINHWRSKEKLQVRGLLKDDTDVSPPNATAKEQIVQLFKAPLLKYTIIMTTLCVTQQIGAFMIWLPMIADQFVRIVQSFDSSDLTMCEILKMERAPSQPDANPCALKNFSLFLVFGIGVSQFIVNICISAAVHTVGRRNIILFVTLVCGVCGILVNLVHNIIGSAVLFAIMLQGIDVLGLYVATMVTLFPTHVRTMAISIAMTGGRSSTFVSIQILNTWLDVHCNAAFFLFSSMFTGRLTAAYFESCRLQIHRGYCEAAYN